MKYSRLLFVTTALAFVLFSCQKEVDFPPGQNPGTGTGNPGTGNPGSGNPGGGGSNPGTNDIVGNYDLIDVSAHTSATVVVDAGVGGTIKSVTVSDYVSKNNVGTVQITSNQIIVSGMGYDIDTTMNVKTYIGGMLVDDSDFPFVLSSPPTSSTSTYVKNSADSITATGAFGVAQGTSGGGAPSGPVGLKVSWAGDTLSLKVSSTVVENISQGGVPGTLTGSVTGITRLKKK